MNSEQDALFLKQPHPKSRRAPFLPGWITGRIAGRTLSAHCLETARSVFTEGVDHSLIGSFLQTFDRSTLLSDDEKPKRPLLCNYIHCAGDGGCRRSAWAISCVTSSAQLFIVREECIEMPRGDCVFEFVL